MGCGIDSRNRLNAAAELALAPAKAAHPLSLSERADAPPGAKARSRPNGSYRNLRDPSAATGRSPVGAANEGQPQDAAPRMGVGPLHSIGEVAEGNEVMERRERQEGITTEQAKGRTLRWQPLLPNLRRVNDAARRSGQTRFTALLHHVDVAALERAFRRQRRTASPGVDRVTVDEYEQALESNLQHLHERVHSGQYWPKPVRRTYIPKSDGGRRPLGIPALEDKIVQGAVAEVLNAVYEADFRGFSHGFRPGRSPHSALAALERAVMTQRVNWVLDLDIRTFFDSVDHGWLVRMLGHRIADPRVLRLIERWLKAGVLESGRWEPVEVGTPQGSGISPILANVFLHYVVDLWVHHWRRHRAAGQIIVCRYADDLAIGCQKEVDGKQLLAALRDRLKQFGLSVHEDKTRLIEFGRFAVERRAAAGQRRPETFNFLGFTHYCSKTRNGKFVVKRKTQAKRLVRKLKAIREDMLDRMHTPVREQHRWLRQVLRGHYQYYGVIFNYRALRMFKDCVVRLWRKTLGKRSQKGRVTWASYTRLLAVFPLPEPVIQQAWHR
jgi:RNA-directed DNA polymerase